MQIFEYIKNHDKYIYKRKRKKLLIINKTFFFVSEAKLESRISEKMLHQKKSNLFS